MFCYNLKDIHYFTIMESSVHAFGMGAGVHRRCTSRVTPGFLGRKEKVVY